MCIYTNRDAATRADGNYDGIAYCDGVANVYRNRHTFAHQHVNADCNTYANANADRDSDPVGSGQESHNTLRWSRYLWLR